MKSRITRRSAVDLGIKKGIEAYALIKANWVTLEAPTPIRRAQESANFLIGVFEEVSSDRGRLEASIRLPGGEVLWATSTEKPVRGLRFTKGGLVRAFIDPAHVILGVTDVPRF